MSSVDSIRRDLSRNAERAQNYIDDLLKDIGQGDVTAADVDAFNSAYRQQTIATWAKSTELKVKHNLAQKIIDGIR